MPTDSLSDKPIALNVPVVDGGLKRIPFFNGRVLTAEDLQTEQQAHAAERRRLGRALGTGVLDGLFIERKNDTTVTVRPGNALAPDGRVVELPDETDVSVVSSLEREETAGTRGKFEDCATQTATVTTGTGAYLLVVRPAAKTEGRVPQTRLGGDGAAGACGAKHRVEGAALSLVHLDTDDEDLVPAPIQKSVQDTMRDVEKALEEGAPPASSTKSMLRNLLAHACLRTPQALGETADLYTALRDAAQGEAGPNSDDPAGPTDVQAYSDVGPCAVPIGLLYWAQDRILFVDNWSVRRRIHRAAPDRPPTATARRRAETEAAIYQFQDHVADLVRRHTVNERAQLRVRKHFAFLPPLGIVPIERSTQDGLHPSAFFDGLTARDPVFVERGKLRELMSEAAQFDAFRIDPELLIWRYHVREDVQSSGGVELPAFVLFTSGFVPYAATPQYNLSRWNYGSYGPGVTLH